MTPRTLTNPLKLECKYQWNCKILNRNHGPGLVRPKSLYYNPRQIIYHTCKWLCFTLDGKPHFILIRETDVDRIFIILLEYPPYILRHRKVRLELHERYLGIQSCLLTCYWLPSFLRRRRQWHPTRVLLPRKSHRWRSLVGCSPWRHEESDTTERLHFYFSL